MEQKKEQLHLKSFDNDNQDTNITDEGTHSTPQTHETFKIHTNPSSQQIDAPDAQLTANDTEAHVVGDAIAFDAPIYVMNTKENGGKCETLNKEDFNHKYGHEDGQN